MRDDYLERENERLRREIRERDEKIAALGAEVVRLTIELEGRKQR